VKVFYTPAIDGEFQPLKRARVADIPDAAAYDTVKLYGGQEAVDELDSQGFTKILAKAMDANQTGYWTYQQDEL